MFIETVAAGLCSSLFTVAALLFGASNAQAQDWSLLDAVLADHVAPTTREGLAYQGVDYAGLAADPRYPELLAQLESFPLASLENQQQRLAFYINAYNVYAIKMVLDHYPLNSIRDAGSLFSSVWKKPVGLLGGQPVTLDQIEHEILRPMGEPRIHFAIVCASLSCPNLRPQAYRAQMLEAQLQEQTRAFLKDEGKGLRVEGQLLRVSQIFDWFKEDFAAAGGVEAFIRQYHPLPARLLLRANLPYDWRLNRQ